MGTFVVILILLAVLAAAAASVIRDRKNGKCSCDESPGPGTRAACGSCTGCGACAGRSDRRSGERKKS